MPRGALILARTTPDIRAAEQNLVAANANIGVAKAAYFPQLSLTGALGGQSNQLVSLFNTFQRDVELRVPDHTADLQCRGDQIQPCGYPKRSGSLRWWITKGRLNGFRETSDALVEQRKVREVRTQRELLVTTLRDRSRMAYSATAAA